MPKPARKINLQVVKERFTDKPNVILSAVNQLVDFVSPTLGPKIRHVLVDMGYKSELMDDGVSIAKEFELEDEFENAVVEYVKEASEKSDKVAGDGTTTTMVILRRLLAELIGSGKSYPEIRAELSKAVPAAVDEHRHQDDRAVDLRHRRSGGLRRRRDGGHEDDEHCCAETRHPE